MKIALIWKNDYPWDIRVEKISNSLREAGHDVYLLCGNKKQLKRAEVIDGINVIRLPFTHNRFMNSIISLPFHFNPFWLKMASETVRHVGIELVIVRDLPLMSIGIFLKKRFGIPLILDMAENYPAMYRDRIEKGGWTAIKNWFIKNPYLIEYTEKRAIQESDHIFVVVDESAQRLIAAGADSAKISIVSNTPDLRNISNAGPDEKHSHAQLIYVGFVQERGLDIVVKSLGRLRDVGIPVKFMIIGDGHYLNQLKLIAKQHRVEHMVEFKGWVKSTSIHAYIQKSDIGVIPHRKNSHIDTTVPNKLFDYMACGKPVIASNAKPLQRIIEEERCGVLFSSGSVESFTEALTQMLRHPAAAAEMGQNGIAAVKRRYNWSYDSAVLKRVVATFRTQGARELN